MNKQNIIPVPCTNVRGRTVKEWLLKIDEELNEVKEVIYAARMRSNDDIRDFKMDGDKKRLAEECIDVITAVTSMLEAAGVDEAERQKAQGYVNKKNRERGYW